MIGSFNSVCLVVWTESTDWWLGAFVCSSGLTWVYTYIYSSLLSVICSCLIEHPTSFRIAQHTLVFSEQIISNLFPINPTTTPTIWDTSLPHRTSTSPLLVQASRRSRSQRVLWCTHCKKWVADQRRICDILMFTSSAKDSAFNQKITPWACRPCQRRNFNFSYLWCLLLVQMSIREEWKLVKRL